MVVWDGVCGYVTSHFLSPETNFGIFLQVVRADSQDYEILYNFFTPLGPMFRLLYRLLNDSVKYDVQVSLLPVSCRFVLRRVIYLSDSVSAKNAANVGGWPVFEFLFRYH